VAEATFVERAKTRDEIGAPRFERRLAIAEIHAGLCGRVSIRHRCGKARQGPMWRLTLMRGGVTIALPLPNQQIRRLQGAPRD